MALFNYITNDNKVGKLVIYSNDYLQATTVEAQQQAVALEFDSMLKFDFDSGVEIAEKNIENADFRNDSMHDTANKIVIKAIKMRTLPNGDAVSVTEKKAQDLLRSLTVCTIVQRYPLFNQYNNYKFAKFQYTLDGSCNTLVPTMIFQEIRTGATEFGGNSAFNNDSLANPENAAQVDNGNVTPVPVEGTPTYYNSLGSP